ncbi:DUF6907 domain-containing protein [Streptomyces sp. NBC_00582]|uniref:DUF6907 domain-containing protein n=1 Tax=Streptomyces sp. NBC_00582 TaxID=2975783 RepID=UPI002E81B4A5|nr:hypothetical protein [Streptomyces sp. NBC_00582]WUB60454.1 hypothetical protein OG852_08680 [Streptomyces sp. NBC_00582]
MKTNTSVNLAAIPSQPSAVEQSPLQLGSRLVPAKIGRTNGTSVTVWIQCPTWCTEDHVDEPVRDVEDLAHYSATAGVSVYSFTNAGAVHELFAGIQSDPTASDARLRGAHISIEDRGGNDYAQLTPEMAEHLADELIGFASELRHLARIAQQANEVTKGRAA